MISLRDATICDCLPRVLTAQPWVQAIALTKADVKRMVLDYSDRTEIYTNLYKLPEATLDALAVNSNCEWYDTAYDLATKQTIIRDMIAVIRTMGTPQAVETAVQAVFENSEIIEWYTYGGEPGYFRVGCTINDTDKQIDLDEIRRSVARCKRVIARLERIIIQYSMPMALYHGVARHEMTYEKTTMGDPAEVEAAAALLAAEME